MRRAERSADPALARSLFQAAPAVQLAGTTPEGAPVLRSVNGVVVEDERGWSVAFHGAPAGEKLLCVGRDAVMGCERIVAEIPSWFTSEERACPATTWYQSAQISGALEAVEAPEEKAQILQALMARFQPEGRHRAIRAEDSMYAAAVRGLLVVRLRPQKVSAKVSTGQDKPPEVRLKVLEQLWRRGAPGDVEALALSLSAAPVPWPEWLQGPPGIRLLAALNAEQAEEAAQMLEGAEWNQPFSPLQLRAAIRSSVAFVGALQGDRVVATARAVSDGVKLAYIGDVFVREDLRGSGVGAAVMRLLLDHPAVRGCRGVLLRTLIAEGFYHKLGFTTLFQDGERPWMVRR